jgi:hypothetical protein
LSEKSEVTGERRTVHNEELYDLYSSPNIIRVIETRRIRWVGHVALWRRGTYRLLMGKSEGKKQHGSPTLRVEGGIIKMDLQEVRWDVDWIDLPQDRDR